MKTEKLTAYLHTCNIRKDGSKDSFLTQQVEIDEKPLWWQTQGLSYTASGYGSRIPTRYRVKINVRWRRVYCRIYSNVGTLFIGKKYDGTNAVSIDMD